MKKIEKSKSAKEIKAAKAKFFKSQKKLSELEAAAKKEKIHFQKHSSDNSYSKIKTASKKKSSSKSASSKNT